MPHVLTFLHSFYKSMWPAPKQPCIVGVHTRHSVTTRSRYIACPPHNKVVAHTYLGRRSRHCPNRRANHLEHFHGNRPTEYHSNTLAAQRVLAVFCVLAPGNLHCLFAIATLLALPRHWQIPNYDFETGFGLFQRAFPGNQLVNPCVSSGQRIQIQITGFHSHGKVVDILIWCALYPQAIGQHCRPNEKITVKVEVCCDSFLRN